MVASYKRSGFSSISKTKNRKQKYLWVCCNFILMLYLKKTPRILKKFFSERVWNIKTDEKILYLTFDDGPHPEATLFVLAELKNIMPRLLFSVLVKM
jgi:peptidoglycan/xylan/chitin deacetylase (PgdA/CDA1 family)